MTDHKPLTAAQIAEIEARATPNTWYGHRARLVTEDIPALVRDLRAAREALAKIANLPRGDFVLHGPRLPAAIARAALPEETPNG